MGALDFAGGTVVHISSGIAALAFVLSIGRRKGYGKAEIIPHSVMLTVLGASLLWFGWFGVNAGSSLAANGLAVNAFVVTNTAAAAATMSWIFVEWIHRGKPTALGAASGAVAGLVAITPASGFVGPIAAVIIGAVVSVLCYGAINLKSKFGYDDSLDVFGVHGIGGIWGAIATGIFASKAINPAGANGLLHGNPRQLLVQALTVLIVVVYSFVVTTVLVKLTNIISPIRVSEEDEELGLDLSQHGELGYHGEDL
jgi:Amt family ammonium transporter